MSLPRVLLTPYLNTRPLWHHGAPRGCTLDTLAPRLAVDAMLRGEALAAVVPVAGLPRLQGVAELLGPYGVEQSVFYAARGTGRWFAVDLHLPTEDGALAQDRPALVLTVRISCSSSGPTKRRSPLSFEMKGQVRAASQRPAAVKTAGLPFRRP